MSRILKNKLTPLMLATALSVVSVAAVPQAMAVPALSGIFGAKPKFLSVSQAFNVTASETGNVLTVRFVVTPEHYVYKDKLKLKLPDGVQMDAWQFDSTPTMIDDPEFGRVAVFERDVVATVKLTNQRDTAIDEPIKLTWQGCAKAGLCYPPENLSINVSLEPAVFLQAHAGQEKAKPSNESTAQTNPDGKSIKKTTLSMDGLDDLTSDNRLTDGNASNVGQDVAVTSPVLVGNGLSLSLPSSPMQAGVGQTNRQAGEQANTHINTPTDGTLNGQMGQPSSTQATLPTDMASLPAYPLNHTAQAIDRYGFGLDKNPILAIGLLFLAGIALAFTACVYPMIPIVANIVAKSHKPTAMRGFVLTSAYGLGVATSYGLLGAVVAWFGQGLGIVGWLQNRWILTVFALLFVLFALQMMGVLKLGLPATLKLKLSRHAMLADRHLGRVWGSFLVGMLSALVVSPCVSAPMAGALAGVAVSNNVALGFGALFALGLGLSVPLMVMGTLEGKFMPKAGVWMEQVKRFGALMLLAVGLVLLDRAWGSSWVLVLWAVWFAVLALFFWQWAKVGKVLALVAGAWVCVLMMGVGMGANDVLRPLHPLMDKMDKSSAGQLPDIHITSLADLDKVLKTTPKVVVDVTAEWCVECRIMERTLFAKRPAVMADWQLVHLDITETSDDSRAVLSRYGLFGPPALLYYQEGQLVQVQLGEVSYTDFEMALQLGR